MNLECKIIHFRPFSLSSYYDIIQVRMVFLAALFALASCSANENSHDEYIAKTKTIVIRDSSYSPDSSKTIFKGVDYIVFDQSPASAFSAIDKVIHYKNRFIILDRLVASKVLAFDTSGKFIMAYGSKGELPGQYTIPMDIFLDSVQNELLVLNSEKRLINVYNFEDGRFLRNIDYDFSGKQFHKLNSGNYVFLGGAQQDRILITDNQLKKQKSAIPFIPRYGTMLINQLQSNGDSILTFRLSYNDTVFQISNKGNVHPYLIVDFGKFKFSDQDYENLSAGQKSRLHDNVLEKKTSLVAYAENEEGIYIVYRYQGKIYSYFQSGNNGRFIHIKNEPFADKLFPVEKFPIIIGKDGAGNFLASLKAEDFQDNFKLPLSSKIEINEFSNPVLVKLKFN